MLKRIDKYLPKSVDVSRLGTAKTATPLTDRLAKVTLNGNAIDMDIVAHHMDDSITVHFSSFSRNYFIKYY